MAARPEFRERAARQDIAVFIITPTFYNRSVLEEHPDWAAITSKGQPAQKDWVRFLCPSRQEYRQLAINQIAQWVTDLDPEGISIDFIRHFVYWEMVHPDHTSASLPQSCFDENCLAEFSRTYEIQIPPMLNIVSKKADWILAHHADRWIEWKCQLITSMVSEITQEAKRRKLE